MGNYLGCMGSGKKKKTTKKVSVNGGMRRTRGSLEDELMMEQQALAHMALHPHHHEHKGAQLLRFESSSNSLSSSLHRDHLPAGVTTTAPPRRSYSGKPSSSSKVEYTRSSSTRPRHSSDLLLDPQQLLNCTRVWFFPLPPLLSLMESSLPSWTATRLDFSSSSPTISLTLYPSSSSCSSSIHHLEACKMSRF